MTFDTQKLRDALSNTSREPWITEQDEDSDYTTVGPGQDGCVQNSMFRIHSEAHADLIVELHNSAWDLLDTIDAQAAEIERLRGLVSEMAHNDTYETEYDGRMYSICHDCGAQDGEAHRRPDCLYVRARAALSQGEPNASNPTAHG